MEEDLSYYNSNGSELRILQLKMLDILKVVTDIADKHNIPYWLSGGTLLGTIRHGGFIPWDDDIDIELFRNDYKNLLNVLTQELPSDLYLQRPTDKGYRLLFSKVRDRNSRILESDDHLDVYEEKGIYIDIFSEERSYRELKSFVDFFYGRSFRRIKRGKPFHSFRFFYEYSLSLLLYPLGALFVLLARLFCKVLKPTTVLHSYGIGNSTTHDISYILPLSKVNFEGMEFSAPGNPHLYLSKQYGKYMSIPPKDKRESHILEVTYK